MQLTDRLGGTGRDRGSWLALLLILVAVLAPTACILWFMNEAMNNQRDAARQKLTEAYRGQLALVRDGLDTWWEKRAGELERKAETGTAAVVFDSSVREKLADSVILLNRDGSVGYPSSASAAAAHDENSEGWVQARALENVAGGLAKAADAYARIAAKEKDASAAARAVQAEIRCLVQSGEDDLALRVIEQQFGAGRFARATDSQGRLIAADEQLLALNLSDGTNRTRLQTMLLDYSLPMPSAQRLFLMQELPGVHFPTYDAERLAAAVLDTGSVETSDATLRPSGIAGVWKSAAGGRVIAIYRTETLIASLKNALNGPNASPDLAFSVTAPDARPQGVDDSTAAGPRLPGWRVTMTIRNRGQFEQVARQHTASYTWIGFLCIATMVVLAGIAGDLVRCQIRQARLKTDLVAAVSHEIKTPLSAIRLLVDTMIEDRDFDPARTREYLEMVARENLRLSRVIDNFLTFARMERTQQKFECVETPPASVVDAAIRAAGERFESPQCRLEVDVNPGLPMLRADQDALVAVLLNLLDNAYKFSPGSKHIRLRAYQESGRLCFAVADSGIGIPAREQKKIFRRFYQIDRRLTRPVGGVGLGLSIVEFIVRAHGGEIRVNSQPGVGSTFVVAMPCAAAADDSAQFAAERGAA